MRVTASVRIQWFHNELMRGSYPNAPRIAEFFGISTRQAQRDIDLLKKQYGAPVAFDRKHGGYYYEAEFNLPVMVTTENDDIFRSITQNPFAQNDHGADSLIIQSQIPYTATVEIKDKLTVLEMRSYIIATEKRNRFLCEFHNVDRFLCAIFAARSGITVIEPEWLRTKLFDMIKKVEDANPRE
ncbi:MAG: hypothetical protein E7589_02445 [Ruminococcaceae bacterium]|nr:hypothetical protein [Oscillospiraceae bacterium]